LTTARGDQRRNQATMKTPVVLVTAGLTVAILVVASFLIATGTRGESSLWPPAGDPSEQILPSAGK
jgi:hypothetical protein